MGETLTAGDGGCRVDAVNEDSDLHALLFGTSSDIPRDMCCGQHRGRAVAETVCALPDLVCVTELRDSVELVRRDALRWLYDVGDALVAVLGNNSAAKIAMGKIMRREMNVDPDAMVRVKWLRRDASRSRGRALCEPGPGRLAATPQQMLSLCEQLYANEKRRQRRANVVRMHLSLLAYQHFYETACDTDARSCAMS